jgi:hypothetical protein
MSSPEQDKKTVKEWVPYVALPMRERVAFAKQFVDSDAFKSMICISGESFLTSHPLTAYIPVKDRFIEKTKAAIWEYFSSELAEILDYFDQMRMHSRYMSFPLRKDLIVDSFERVMNANMAGGPSAEMNWGEDWEGHGLFSHNMSRDEYLKSDEFLSHYKHAGVYLGSRIIVAHDAGW